MADFSGSDPIIYREPLQTEQYDSLSLNGKFIRHIELSLYCEYSSYIYTQLYVRMYMANMANLKVYECGFIANILLLFCGYLYRS